MTRRIYLDLDGVMANLEAGLDDLFGPDRDRKEPITNVGWKKILAEDGFFLKLPAMKGAYEFFNSIDSPTLSILTACPHTRYEDIAKQKVAWVRKHLSEDVVVLPVHMSDAKPLFMNKPGDILIDDYGKNCRAWEEAGGVAIKHEGIDFDTTYWKLKEVLANE